MKRYFWIGCFVLVLIAAAIIYTFTLQSKKESNLGILVERNTAI